MVLCRDKIFISLSVEQLRQQAPFVAVTGWCVCKVCGDVENANAEYVSSVYGKIHANPENLKHCFSQYLPC